MCTSKMAVTIKTATIVKITLAVYMTVIACNTTAKVVSPFVKDFNERMKETAN